MAESKNHAEWQKGSTEKHVSRDRIHGSLKWRRGKASLRDGYLGGEPHR
jgi:hypothetical protein